MFFLRYGRGSFADRQSRIQQMGAGGWFVILLSSVGVKRECRVTVSIGRVQGCYASAHEWGDACVVSEGTSCRLRVGHSPVREGPRHHLQSSVIDT